MLISAIVLIITKKEFCMSNRGKVSSVLLFSEHLIRWNGGPGLICSPILVNVWFGRNGGPVSSVLKTNFRSEAHSPGVYFLIHTFASPNDGYLRNTLILTVFRFCSEKIGIFYVFSWNIIEPIMHIFFFKFLIGVTFNILL